MNELTQTKPARPMNTTDDTAALNALVGFLNSPTMSSAEADTRKGETGAVEALMNTTPSNTDQAEQAAANPLLKPTKILAPAQVPASVASAPSIDLRRVFMTGRLCAGKDHVAALTGAAIEGFARPLYHLAEHFFGIKCDATAGKDLPGVREFLQIAGQWGRAVVSPKYPLTPARAVFITAIRSLGAAGVLSKDLGVDWDAFGRDENIWLNAALVRVAASNAERVAITGCRFANEFKRLTEQRWTNYHVMTSPEEWAARLAKRNIAPASPVLKDESEALAAHLDAQVVKEISAHRNGAKLRVIWNSDKPCPSVRLWTVSQFLQAGNAAPASQDDALADLATFTGE